MVELDRSSPVCLAEVPDVQTASQPGLVDLLGPRERQYWTKAGPESPRSRQWLAGRLAAKCALDMYLRKEHSVALTPDHLEIVADDQGAPVAAGACRLQPFIVPDLSVAHTGDLAAAVAAHRTGRLHPGVDVERSDRSLSPRFVKAVFSTEEQNLLARLSNQEQNTWLIRLWCAREAAAKSLHLGLVTRTHHFSLEHLDLRTGLIEVRLSRQLSAEIAYPAPPVIAVRTLKYESWILAVTDMDG